MQRMSEDATVLDTARRAVRRRLSVDAKGRSQVTPTGSLNEPELRIRDRMSGWNPVVLGFHMIHLSSSCAGR